MNLYPWFSFRPGEDKVPTSFPEEIAENNSQIFGKGHIKTSNTP